MLINNLTKLGNYFVFLFFPINNDTRSINKKPYSHTNDVDITFCMNCIGCVLVMFYIHTHIKK